MYFHGTGISLRFVRKFDLSRARCARSYASAVRARIPLKMPFGYLSFLLSVRENRSFNVKKFSRIVCVSLFNCQGASRARCARNLFPRYARVFIFRARCMLSLLPRCEFFADLFLLSCDSQINISYRFLLVNNFF